VTAALVTAATVAAGPMWWFPRVRRTVVGELSLSVVYGELLSTLDMPGKQKMIFKEKQNQMMSNKSLVQHKYPGFYIK